MFFFLLCLIVSPINPINGFDAGFLQLVPNLPPGSDSTHYTITVCALCRVTIDYLRTVYRVDTTYLETRFNEANGQCQGNIVNEIVNFLKSSSISKTNPWQFSTTIKTIASSNTKTDLKELLEEDSHFDSETFLDASQLVLTRYKAAQESILYEGNFDQARKTFGEMLHTLQDFYSHTNFIELGYTSPSGVLGNRLFQTNEYAPNGMRTCISCKKDDCQTTPNIAENVLNGKILTSGYFIPIGYSIFTKGKPPGKCSHGGFFDATSRHEPTGGISKDKVGAAHDRLHYQAAQVAYLATVQILNQLRHDVGDDKFGQFLTLKQKLNSLIISIDTACSMMDYIDLAKNLSTNIVDQYRTLIYGPYNYILVTFNSTHADVIVNSENPEDLTRAIGNINSCQMFNSTVGELYYHALIEGLKQSEYGSVVYTFTDSPASDVQLKYQARSLLRSKKAVIYSLLSQKMKARIYQAYYDELDPLDGSNNDTDLASISGGLTFPIFVPDLLVISEFIARRLQWTRIQSIMMYKTSSKSTDFYVDPSIEELHLEIASMGEIVNISGMELRMPNNSFYPLTENLNHTKHLYMWKIQQPIAGTWRLITSNLTQGFEHTVQIQAKTSFIYSSTAQRKMEIDRDSSGYTQLTNEPLINSDLLVLTTYSNISVDSILISLIDQSGNLLVNYAPNQTNSFGALTQINVPQQQFRIQTLIKLTNGTQIQRLEKQLISPTIYSIELTNPPFIVRSGEVIVMNYKIRCVTTDQVSVRLEIVDTLKLISNGTIQKNVTFINETSDSETVVLSRTSHPQFTTSLVIFSVSTQNNPNKKISYENDDMASLFVDTDSASTRSINHYSTVTYLFLITILLFIKMQI